MKVKHEYEKDFYGWALENAKLMRDGNFSDLDIENVAEEIESMGRRDKRELMSRLAILLAHLLKWQLQPERQGNSWKNTIEEQRFEISDLLSESPSLKYEINIRLEHAYQKAILITIKETGINKKLLPKNCPFSFEKILKSDFFPS